MEIYYYKSEKDEKKLQNILFREGEDTDAVRDVVLDILYDVRKNGDTALKKHTEKFDGCSLDSMLVSEAEIKEAYSLIEPEMSHIFDKAIENIRSFHEKQLFESFTYEAQPGVMLGQKVTPLDRAGLYVPGGKAAYPSTVLMDAIPAQVAGVDSIAMTTPPDSEGKINPYILVAADKLGINEIYKAGGAQSIAALAYGTESIEAVNKIVGPGNIYVATAKKEVFGTVDIDMIAGPSEVTIITGDTGNPEYLAADLLSQAEHDEMAMCILITTSETLAQSVSAEVEKQLKELPKCEMATKAIRDFGKIFVVENLDEAFRLSNAIAPEHLEIALENPETYLPEIRNAGAIFLGEYTPEPVGDYWAGPNHTLPTSGTAKFSSPLGVYDFLKRSSVLMFSRKALEKDAEKIARFARSEELVAHARSVERRFEK
jgi:histidinol dehydrogenase